MTSTILNSRKKQLLVKKNIIVKFDARSANKACKGSQNNNTLDTGTTFPTTTC